jgi:hypothetical protein
MERNNDMDRMKRIKSWKLFESNKKEAIDVLADVLDAIQDVYDLSLDSIDQQGELNVMCTIDNPASQTGAGEYVFSTKFNSENRPTDYTFDLNNYDAIQHAINAGGDFEILVGLTMIDEDDMEVMDIEATYLLEESMDELNRKWDGMIIKCMGPYDYQENFDYF